MDAARARARACPGRWARAGGLADRRVLDVLCRLALEVVTPVLDIDFRRLGELTGVCHSTAHRSLHRLQQDGWITHAAAAAEVDLATEKATISRPSN